jgi:hypothetical protein
MANIFKIKNNRLLILYLIFCSFATSAKNYNPIIEGENNGNKTTIVNPKSIKTYTKCFDGTIDENDEAIGAGSTNPHPGKISCINTEYLY